jgi:beta-phosphoglucomutase
MAKSVLWDMDGVLVNNGAFHYQSWQETFSRYGFSFDEQVFRATFGMNNTGVLTTVLGYQPEPEFLAEVADYKEAQFREVIKGRIHPIPGVVAWLERFTAWGCRHAVASSGPMANIQAQVKELGLGSYFDALVSAANMPGKPDPAVFLEAARRVDTLPADCIVIEDAIAGVQAARNAGMKCIAVLTTNPPSALAKANVIVPDLTYLAEGTARLLLQL